MKKLIGIIFLFIISNAVSAWSGTDQDGNWVEIESGNLVRSGEDIEYYDSDSGEYKYGTVESVNGNGFGAEVEVYDYDSGEYKYSDMD